MSVRKLHASAPGSPPRIDVRNPAGSVTVEALEGADALDVRVEALDAAAEQLLDRVEIDVSPIDPDRADSPVRLRIAVPERRLMRTPEFAVRVTTPADAAVRVAVASADVDLLGRFARTDVTGASGHLAVDEVADLELRTASGDARVGTVHGRASVGSASGDVRLGRVGGALQVRTASGDVSVEHAGGATSISTASGEVTVAEAAAEAVKVKTASGDVTVGVAPGLRVWLDLASVSGRMTSDLDEDVADSGARPQLSLTLRTVSGDLRIGRSAPAPAA
jgi:Putative adhesin